MGRQIRFYMLPDDRDAFLRFVQEREPVAVIARDSDAAEVQPADDLDGDAAKTLCLWNRRFLPHFERKWIPEPGYFRADTLKMPILEFAPSFTATWQGKPALGQGRLFGNFEAYLGKPEAFKKWYESLARWIRENYQRNPYSTGGYLGPSSYELYNSGAYLLPNFLPPTTKEWEAEIGKQHSKVRMP